MTDSTRREFLKRTTTLIAASAIASAPAAAADDAVAPAKSDADAAAGKSDPFVLGCIGVGGQGMNLLQSFAAMKDVRRTLDSASKAIDSAGKAMTSAGRAVAEDSTLQQDLRGTLQELSRAAVSLRVLTDYLEQHPESLLRGKPRDSR